MNKILFATTLLLSSVWSTGQTFAGLSNGWINEIHYDNFGGDVGEGVEVVVAAGTDVTGWEVVFYNGSNGTRYADEDLGTLSSTDGLVDYYSIPLSGIQNGAPDGLALFNGTSVVQFLSYEGTFTATNNVANGLMSTDIGIAEFDNSNFPVGTSLQLTGSGNSFEDFSWTSAGQTFGAINVDQSISAVPEPSSLTYALIFGLSMIGPRRRR